MRLFLICFNVACIASLVVLPFHHLPMISEGSTNWIQALLISAHYMIGILVMIAGFFKATKEL